MGTTRVLLVERNPLLRRGLRAAVEPCADMEVVGETGDERFVGGLIEKALPTVLVVGVPFPGVNVQELVAKGARRLPPVRVLLIASPQEEGEVSAALCVGIAGYLFSDSSPEELVCALRTASLGGTYLCACAASIVCAHFADALATPSCSDIPLSPRQKEILQLTGLGQDVKEIAHRLGLSEKTVYTHRARLAQRLGIHNLAGLVRLAVGLVSGPSSPKVSEFF